MIWFAIASLTPAILLVLGAILGGIWPLMGAVSITLLVFVIDHLVSRQTPETEGVRSAWVSYCQAIAHFAVWGFGIWSISVTGHLPLVSKILMVIGMGLYFGQISNSNAHELIHNPVKWRRRLGVAIYCSILFGHHTSAHMRVHHVHAATDKDPNTARLGEGFWRYFLRAWATGYTAGKRAEDMLRARGGAVRSGLSHPYWGYTFGAAASVLAAFALDEARGVLTLFIVALYAQIQLYLSDYVQHYGLRRRLDSLGQPEPMGARHSWNAPHWYSSAMMLNAPRHSDHHANPARPFPDLRLDEDTMPMLPHSLPVMAVVALIPPVWHAMMDGRASDWMRNPAPIDAA